MSEVTTPARAALRAKVRTGKEKRSPRAQWLRVPRSLTGYLLAAPALLYLLLLNLYPLLRTVQMSFINVAMASSQFVGLQHYRDLLQDPWFWNSLRVTATFTVPALIIHFLIAFGLALLLNQTWFSVTLRNFVRGALILPWVFSTAASALMWALLLHEYGPVNYVAVGVFHRSAPIAFLAESTGLALASLIAVNTWLSYPFLMIVILGGLQAISPELYEAAKVDGANARQRFRHITLPQLRSILLPIATIDMIWTFGQLDLVNLLTRGGPLRGTETVTYYLYKTAMLDGDLGYGAAIGTFMLAVLAVLTVLYVRIGSRGGEAGETSF